ncbi:unnamed protein product [Closterium sp. NIES-64]|nr:unnamed protein product [Closterium sp. NIES-64]
MPNDPQPNDHGPFLLETDPMPAVGSEEEAPAGNEDGLVPEIYVALPEEKQRLWRLQQGRRAKIKGDHQVANDNQVPNDHGPYLLGTDAAISAVGSEEAPAGNEKELVPAVLVPHPEEAAPGEAPAGNEDVLVPEIYVALPEDSAPGEAPAGNEDGLVPEICVALPEEAAPGEAAVAGSQGDAPMPDGAESSALVPIPNDHGPYLLGVDSTVGSEEEASVGEEQAPVKLPDVLVPLPEESAPGEAEAAGSVAPEN